MNFSGRQPKATPGSTEDKMFNARSVIDTMFETLGELAEPSRKAFNDYVWLYAINQLDGVSARLKMTGHYSAAEAVADQAAILRTML